MVHFQKEIAMATVTGNARFALNPRFSEALEVVTVEACAEPDKISSNGKTEAKNDQHVGWKPSYWLYAAVGVIVLYWLLKK